MRETRHGAEGKDVPRPYGPSPTSALTGAECTTVGVEKRCGKISRRFTLGDSSASSQLGGAFALSLPWVLVTLHCLLPVLKY